MALLPWLFFAIPAGILIDRIDRRHALALANGVRTALALALFVLVATDGIVTHPGRARDTLGLHWRLGASHTEIEAAARTFVRPGTTAILSVHDDGRLWTSLVLDFDDEWKVTSITTADPSLVEITGTREEVLGRLVRWVEGTGKSVSLAMALDREAADALLASPAAEKGGALLRLLAQHTVSVGRAPEALRLG